MRWVAGLENYFMSDAIFYGKVTFPHSPFLIPN